MGCLLPMLEWWRARDAGGLAALAAPRGRQRPDPRDAQIAALRREKERLEQELAKARFVVDVQTKLGSADPADLAAQHHVLVP